MQKVKSNLKQRMLMIALAIVMVWGVFAFSQSQSSYACPSQEIEITYYTDASKTVECGLRIIPCNCGSPYVWGRQTAYRTISYEACH